MTHSKSRKLNLLVDLNVLQPAVPAPSLPIALPNPLSSFSRLPSTTGSYYVLLVPRHHATAHPDPPQLFPSLLPKCLVIYDCSLVRSLKYLGILVATRPDNTFAVGQQLATVLDCYQLEHWDAAKTRVWVLGMM